MLISVDVTSYRILTASAGSLLRIDTLYPVPLEAVLRDCKALPEEDIAHVASFIRACVRLDPGERASASELLHHKWLLGAWSCCDHATHADL